MPLILVKVKVKGGVKAKVKCKACSSQFYSLACHMQQKAITLKFRVKGSH